MFDMELVRAVSSFPAQSGVAGFDYGQLLVALVAVAVIILFGRAALHLAWRLVTIVVVVVAVLYLVSLFAPSLL